MWSNMGEETGIRRYWGQFSFLWSVVLESIAVVLGYASCQRHDGGFATPTGKAMLQERREYRDRQSDRGTQPCCDFQARMSRSLRSLSS